jgi:hypothetical protein
MENGRVLHKKLSSVPVKVVSYIIDVLLSPNRLCRVSRKFLRDIRSLQYSSRDGHAEGEHVNRGRDTANFCPA